jgi:hypothetical protein
MFYAKMNRKTLDSAQELTITEGLSAIERQAVSTHHPVPGRLPAAAKPAKATPTSKVHSVKPPMRPPRPHLLRERDRRMVKRRGKLKALVGGARFILVIVWQLLADPTARFHATISPTHRNGLPRHHRTCRPT